ncbi:hypothetical protein ACKLNQ_12465 [Myroides odoratimimus]|uniref:hypothetical protein n=1 Tax=Myroides odoratimimus TaxID=76832 RepID=UPI0038D48B9F
MYKISFKEFVNKGVQDEFFVGTGNPNASVLIVGKESAIDNKDVIRMNQYKCNAQTWQNHYKNNTCEVLEYAIDYSNPLNKSWGSNTWSKYQKLIDLIRGVESTKYVDFLKYVFTTEINDSPSLTTSKAIKDSLNQRKELFKNTDFIQEFPVVVLACSNYFVNSGELLEINNVFGVKYADVCKVYTKYNWFYVHYNQDRTKMVIHTRNLNSNVKAELIEDLAVLIKEHLNKLEIQL